MSVESTLTKKIYQANSDTKEWPVPFSYSRAEDIHLMHTNADGIETPIISNFRVNKNDSGDTSVTYPITGQPLPLGVKLTVYRETPLTQIIDLIYGGAFSPDVLEKDGFDRIVMMIQEIQDALFRKVGVPVSSEQSPDEFVKELFALAKEAAESAMSAQDALRLCRELLSILPAPTDKDVGKSLYVVSVGGKAQYTLMARSGGGGGGGSGVVEYSIPVNTPDGKVTVRLADIGHPEMPGLFNPTVNLISVVPHYFCIVNRTKEEFTVQIYNPDGTPGVEISEYIECGTFECGDGIECGQEGEGSNVELAVSIPMPAV